MRDGADWLRGRYGLLCGLRSLRLLHLDGLGLPLGLHLALQRRLSLRLCLDRLANRLRRNALGLRLGLHGLGNGLRLERMLQFLLRLGFLRRERRLLGQPLLRCTLGGNFF